MKNIFKNLFLITIPSIFLLLLLLELFFRFIIPAAETPQPFFDERELIYKFDTTAKREGLYTIGKAAQQRGHWRINNYGWNSGIDYVEQREKKLIAIFGDSYIEAYQVDINKSYPSLLRKTFSDIYEVYSFGRSGAPLSEYLNYCRYANRHFNPDILIFNMVHDDFDESIFQLNPNDVHMLTLNINDSIITENIPKPNFSFLQYNWKKRIILKSALFRYVYINLHLPQTIGSINISAKNQKIFNANVDVAKLEENKSLIIKSIDYILQKIYEENPTKRIIFIIDAPRNDIYCNNLKNSNVLFLHDILKKYCFKYGFEYIDLILPMENDYKNHQIKFNSELDFHWNEYGHRFVSNQIIKHLKK